MTKWEKTTQKKNEKKIDIPPKKLSKWILTIREDDQLY